MSVTNKKRNRRFFMKKQTFNWIITETDIWIVVKLNGGINCMFQKHYPGSAFNKQKVLQDIEFSKKTGEVTVTGIEILLKN